MTHSTPLSAPRTAVRLILLLGSGTETLQLPQQETTIRAVSLRCEHLHGNTQMADARGPTYPEGSDVSTFGEQKRVVTPYNK